jgi:glycine oxidase
LPINAEVIVVGGGAIGAACARELARAGHQVLLLERVSTEGVSWRAAAGMLAPQIEAAEADPLFDLAVAARERYVELALDLQAATGIDIQFWQEGIARLATQAGDVPQLEARVVWQRRRGHQVEWLEAAQVQARWPWLGPSYGALWAPREAALNPSRLVEALVEDAKLAGARVGADRVERIEINANRVAGITGAGARYSASQVVLAAGAWAPAIKGLPRPLPVVPVRGQMAAFPWPSGVKPGIVYGAHSYVVAREGEAVVGSTMEHAGFNTTVTPEGVAAIVRGAEELLPALRGKKPARTWAGLRPMTPDAVPILGPEPLCEGLWYALGHGRNGILWAGLTGLLITRMLSGTDPGWDVTPMRPERFYTW